MIDEPDSAGQRLGPEDVRRIIEQEYLGPDSVFAEAHPEGIVYCDPSLLGDEPGGTLFGAFDDGSGYWLDYTIPLNGEWSDMSVRFRFFERKTGLAVVLQDLLPH